jgi:Baseplate J-like protein
MNETCGCCEGVQKLTPHDIANRPGLNALFYRIGTHASFLETMIARLSSHSLAVPLNIFDVEGQEEIATTQPLQTLTTRAPSDPAIAFLDAWATVAAVLTFYQERIANEGYLRTAIERRSILELARLVGYTLRPGVSASVYLAYTLEKDHNVVIDPGNRAQSVPGPGEKAQPFETAEKLEARFAWNTLKPRLTRPLLINVDMLSGTEPTIYLQGTATNIKPGDPILVLVPVLNTDGTLQETLGIVTKVSTVEKQPAAKRTKITLASLSATDTSPAIDADTTVLEDTISSQADSPPPLPFFIPKLGDIVRRLEVPPSLQPPNSQRLVRDATRTFAPGSDIHPQILINAAPVLQNTFYSAAVNAPTTPTDLTTNAPSIQTFGVQAAPFGHNAPPHVDKDGKPLPQDWPLVNAVTMRIFIQLFPTHSPPDSEPILAATSSGLQFTHGTIAVIRLQDEHTWTNDHVTIREGEQSIQLIDSNHQIGPTVTIKADPSEIVLTFQFQGGATQVIHLTSQTTAQHQLAIGVRLEPDIEIVVGLNSGSKSTKTPNHESEIDFNSDALTIGDQLVILINTKIPPLDAQYDKIVPQSWVSIERPDSTIISQVQAVQTVFISAYNISTTVTQLVLDRPWLTGTERLLSDIRGIVVHTQSEPQDLAEAPIEEDIAPPTPPRQEPVVLRIAADAAPTVRTFAAVVPTPTPADTINKGTDTIELDQLYDGLKAGQRLIVFGERTDVAGIDNKPVPGILDGELVMLKAIKQDVLRDSQGFPVPGDKPHTTLILANNLRSTYRRDTLVIYANVVRATHGETRNETLGSGNGSQELQTFTLNQFPLTYVSDNTPSGIKTTLEVRVNDLLWHEANSLPELHATDRGYITQTDDADKTTVIFGNGTFGARLPTGVENVTAKYRTGIGKVGNVKAGQITLLSTKPLGVKAVVNPLAASGGADRENVTQARHNVPLAALALDRLVSVEDYEHFAHTFGGVGKASAAPISDGHRQLVYVTIVGADNAPILTTSDLYRNLVSALRQFGDPNEPLIVAVAEVRFIVISARIHLLPDFKFESVEAKVRNKLLNVFSFDNRDLGQSVFESEVIGVIQSVAGVDYVELEILAAVGQEAIIDAVDNPKPGPEEPDETEDEGESPEVERAEEFIEQLGLSTHQDVPVESARPDKNNILAISGIAPAQLAFLTPDVPDTVILTELL